MGTFISVPGVYWNSFEEVKAVFDIYRVSALMWLIVSIVVHRS